MIPDALPDVVPHYSVFGLGETTVASVAPVAPTHL